ncbi:MAG: DUF2087 domain-containing protein [Gemmatimonadota bacterium]|jgi:hypothetical protein
MSIDAPSLRWSGLLLACAGLALFVTIGLYGGLYGVVTARPYHAVPHEAEEVRGEGPWDEAEVNRRLEELADDTATLRRGFIDHGLMTRDPGGRAYSRS